MSKSAAWYFGTRDEFLATPRDAIANQLAGRAADESLEIETAQSEEWRRSVEILQKNLDERLPILREALTAPGCESIRQVILEFDFKRRGLRMDCILLADGALFVIEFKRTKVGRADRDQVMKYAVNLLEFHKVTQEWCKDEKEGAIVVPILVLTEGRVNKAVQWPGLAGHSWRALATKPIECDRREFKNTIQTGLQHRRSEVALEATSWINSPFRPSSSILDATLSLYGNHDVVAIQEHAAPKAAIDASVKEIREVIDATLSKSEYRIIFLSGAPGAGKTLVGLDLVMRGSYASGAVFVTGNAPLVEVLNKALEKSYRSQGRSADKWAQTGYRRIDANLIANAANYKVVKAHHFLGNRGIPHRQEDGRVLVFDEAQRTYEKGRLVLGHRLLDHEANLILDVQRKAFPEGGAVVVALVGHNQAINRGERGMIAWLEAADFHGWSYSIGDETLALSEFQEQAKWASHPLRQTLVNGHLKQSMRYYRNDAVEKWVSAVLSGVSEDANALAITLEAESNSLWITRELSTARRWAKSVTLGGERCGLIASGQARRLAAEGLFVDFKPEISTWMLAPSSDVRSSNALETVQNQFNIQGLELDYSVVCWDADLRRDTENWSAYKLNGSDWQSDTLIDVAKNGYRVLLTRARKGMIIFVPKGDLTLEDSTRTPEFYDGVYEFLLACGVKEWDS